MRFRIAPVLHPFGVTDPTELQFELPRGIQVHLKRQERQGKEAYLTIPWDAEAVVERNPKGAIAHWLLHKPMEVKTLPRQHKVRQFLEQRKDELEDAIRCAINVIRWRVGWPLNQNPVKKGSHLFWQSSSGQWHLLGLHMVLHLRSYGIHKLTDRVQFEIQDILSSSTAEPIAHHLLREAMDLLRQEFLRSSLLIGVAAAELGIKGCISVLDPDSEWLEVASPPLQRLLQEYLPGLKPVPLGLKLKPLPLNEEALIEKAVSMRNQLAHKKPPTIRRDSLEEILRLVSDLLSYFDIACGRHWAGKLIQPHLQRHFFG